MGTKFFESRLAGDSMRPSTDRFKLVLIILLAIVVVFTVADMIEDFSDHPSAVHMAFEFGVVIASTAALGWLAFEWLAARREIARLDGDLNASRAEASSWRAEAKQALNGLSDAIDRQLSDWKLTPAEKEIGLLLLKGLALKEIADLRGTSERTVRHQAQEIYRKASLTGRADFAAFFLEDLLVPRGLAAEGIKAPT